MKTRPLNELEIELSSFLLGILKLKSQDVIADEAKVSQSTVSRAKQVCGRTRATDEFFKLCVYAGIPVELPTRLPDPKTRPDPKTHPDLMNALAEAWDGSDEQGSVLAKVLVEIGKLRRPLPRP